MRPSARLIAESKADLDERERYVLLAARLRILTADGSPGRLLPHLIGGLWDRHRGLWVKPTPAWCYAAAPEYTVQEQQLALLLGLPDSVRFVALFAGRQAGKTRDALLALQFDAISWPGRKSAFISLDYKASREPEAEWAALLQPSWGVRVVKADRSWLFPNGHEVVFRSEEAINSLRGPSLKTIIPDEAAFMQASSFAMLTGSGLASHQFRVILPTTPNREAQWIRDVDATWGLADRQDTHRIIRLETLKNPKVDPVMYDVLVRDMPADVADAELRGIIGPSVDAVYGHVFKRADHVRPLGQLPEAVRFLFEKDDEGRPKAPVDATRLWTKREFDVECDYLAGWDFEKEATVLFKIFADLILARQKGQVKRLRRYRMWAVGEEVNLNVSTDHHARKVADSWGTDIAVIHDAMGVHPNSGGRGRNVSAQQILEEHGFAVVQAVARQNPEIMHRVRTLQRAIRSARRSAAWPAGEITFFVAARPDGLPTCPKLVDALENQRMLHGKPEKDGKREHVADAAGYAACYVLPIAGELPEGMERITSEEEA